MTKAYDGMTRRNLLKYLGNSILFMPVYRTFLDTQAFGVDAAPRRAVFFYYPSGCAPELFFPTAYGALGNLPAFIKPLEGIKSDINVIGNTAYAGHGHEVGMTYCLSGIPHFESRPGPSLDYTLGEKFKGVIPVLRLGINSNGDGNISHQCSFGATGKVNARQNNPNKAFNDLFGGSAGQNGFALEGETASRGLSLKNKKSLLDSNLAYLKSLQTKLGSIEKEKLDQHLTAIRELERRVDALLGSAGNGENMGTTPSPETGGGQGNTNQCTKQLSQTMKFESEQSVLDPKNYDVIADMMNEIAIQAMACRMTNVVLLQQGYAVPEIPFANGKPGTGPSQHHSSHYSAEGNIAEHTANHQYFMSKFANLVKGMKNVQEGNQSLLYNSVVMSFSDVAHSMSHDPKNPPVILAGQAGGYFKTGRHIDGKGSRHNRTLVSICKSFGMPDEFVGDAQTESAKGELPGLTT